MAFFKPPTKTSNTLDASSLNGKPEDQLSVASAATATNADKLDNIDSTGFATTAHNHDLDYLGLTDQASDSDKLDGSHATDFATTNHIHMDLYPIDTPSTDVFTKTLTETSDNYGGTTLEMRCVIPAADISGIGNRVSVTLKASSTHSLVLTSVYIVERDGTTPNGTTVPTQVTFSNYMNGQNIWITTGTIATSDLIEFEIDDTKDYLLILCSSGIYAPMRADGYTYYSTTTADPDAKDMADPSPQTANYVFCVSAINAYTRHQIEFKSGSLYEVNGELTFDGDVLLTGAIDGTTSTSFKIASGEGTYAPEFKFISSPWTLKLLNANNFRLDGDNNNVNTYAIYTGSSCVNLSGNTSSAANRFILDEYYANNYACWDYHVQDGTSSFEEWSSNQISYTKHCSSTITYNLYTTGGVSNRGIELAFATDSSPMVKVYTSATDCATITPSTITLAGKSAVRYHESATTPPESDVIAGDEYWNTGDSKFYKYNGTSWIALN